MFRSRLIDGTKPHPLGPPTGRNRGGAQTFGSWCNGGTTKVFDFDKLVAVAAQEQIIANGWHGEPNQYDIEYMTKALKKALEIE